MPRVRTDILRRYYEVQLEMRPPDASLFEEATFEEYVALKRITYPEITPRAAAEMSPVEKYRKLADELPPNPPRVSAPTVRAAAFDRLPELDLSRAAIAADTELLLLDRIKSISGWEALAGLPQLRRLSVQLSGSSESAPAASATRAKVDLVSVDECSLSCLKGALGATSPRTLSFVIPEVSALNLAVLEGQTRLRELSAGAPIVRGLEHLKGRPLSHLGVGWVSIDAVLRQTLESLAGLIERLTLNSIDAFAPDGLPDLGSFPRLARVELPMPRTHLQDWLEYAIARPQVDFVFNRLEPPQKALHATVEEIYRDLDILRVTKGKSTIFEVSGDLAPDFDAEDNGDLEDRMKSAAKRAKKKVRWSSEADTFVAQARDVATCRWLIDALHGAAPEEPGAPKATARRSRKK